jgi:hypothetical protein
MIYKWGTNESNICGQKLFRWWVTTEYLETSEPGSLMHWPDCVVALMCLLMILLGADPDCCSCCSNLHHLDTSHEYVVLLNLGLGFYLAVGRFVPLFPIMFSHVGERTMMLYISWQIIPAVCWWTADICSSGRVKCSFRGVAASHQKD